MATLQRAVLVEFDNALLHGMKDFAEAANDVLKPHGIAVDAPAYARFFCGRTKASGVSALLKRAGVQQEAAPLAAEILSSYKERLLARAGSVGEQCAAFGAPLLAKNVGVIWVTQLDEAALKLALGGSLPEGVQVLQEAVALVGEYGWENWRRLCRRLDVHERLCAAVVGSGRSARGALAAGLYVTACIDPLAAHQDFSGVDVVTEALDAKLAAELLRLLWQSE